MPDAQWKRFNQRLLHGGLSFPTTLEGKFHVGPDATIQEWFERLYSPGHVTLFLDEADRRVRGLKSRNARSPGIWLGMNTEHVLESKGPTSHLYVPFATQQSIFLSVTGWVESSGYINPLCVFW